MHTIYLIKYIIILKITINLSNHNKIIYCIIVLIDKAQKSQFIIKFNRNRSIRKKIYQKKTKNYSKFFFKLFFVYIYLLDKNNIIFFVMVFHKFRTIFSHFQSFFVACYLVLELLHHRRISHFLLAL